jgi:ATP-dependent helicase/nuclease subunit A
VTGAPPVDEAARERARRDHATSFVLEAGAGTGKTTLLVDRIEAMVRSGHALLTEIAAVTFTENAAATMKLRLRERLERARVDEAAGEAERARASLALEALDRAQISTIHALCAAILGERPLECGVAPGFRVADEAEADLLFQRAWEEWLGERLVAGDPVIAEALDAGILLENERLLGDRFSLRGLARTLLEERDLAPVIAEGVVTPEAWRDELSLRAREIPALLATADEGDLLAAGLRSLARFAEESRFLESGALLRHLCGLTGALKGVHGGSGNKGKWRVPDALERARTLASWAKARGAEWSAAVGASLHGRLVRALQRVGIIYARLLAEEGLLDFVDLLLRARDALQKRASVRQHFRARWKAVIIDEFQDTDPLQVQVAELLTAGMPGALVVVGDSKQSIYRFRRAEVALFRRVSRDAAARPGHAVLQLTQNFRSRPAVLRFVNRVFGELITASEETGQPAYEPIHARSGLPDEPSVIGLRFGSPLLEGEALLREEASALAAYLAEVQRGRLEVRDPATGAVRKSQAGDVLVLARRFSQVRFLEEALSTYGLRFVTEGGKSFFDRQEVHEVLAVLRAVDDPTDRLSLVAALRSSFFGVSDRDIVAYAVSGGYLTLAATDTDRPGGAALAPALVLMRELHERRVRDSVPALLERLYDETRVLAALTGSRRGEAQVSNLEKVVTLARSAQDLGVLTLRGFARLLEERIGQSSEEADLPENRPGDTGAVRILTIHRAKGLEAPMLALYDTADDLITRASVIPLWEEGRVAIGFKGGCQPPGWEALKTADEKKAVAEGRRLLYVAATRARDYLVVPVPPRDAKTGGFWRLLSERLPSADDADVRFVEAEALPAPEEGASRPDLRALLSATGGDAVAARWDAQRAALLEDASARPLAPISATRLAASVGPGPTVSREPGAAGGRDFGALVHKLLEWIPLDGAAGADAMAAALAPGYGLTPDAAAQAAAAVRRALDAPILERARAAGSVYRELPLWFPEGDHLVEGVIDLVFEEGGALVLVDYKTDHIAAAQALEQAAHHAPQLQLYGRGLAQAMGLPVRERHVLFTHLGQTIPV